MTRVKILVAEDEILIARKIEATLQKLGYDIAAIAIDGASAIQKVAETNPDLVLMDILMPGEVDGIEAAKQIRSRFQTPVVYLTAYGDSKTVERARVSEPFGYLIKPFQPQELDSTIQIALGRYQIEQQKLAALRNNISSSLPHEVNTPLTGILGVVNFILTYYDSLSASEVLEMLECIRSSAVRLDRLHQNFLLHTKLSLIATNLGQIQQLTQNYTFSTKSLIHGLVLHKVKEVDRLDDIKLDLQETPVQISEIYLKKIVEELLDNALKFSQTGTVIHIQSTSDNFVFALSVSDRGRGIAPDQLADLEAFMQFDRSRYEQQGLGLGLSLVKRLTELHEGRFAVESAVNQGTTITVQLPVAKHIDFELIESL